MPSDDLLDHANSSQDFYALLGVNFETSESDIRRAYRKTALKYHPDKVGDNPAALEKFHILQIAYDVLSDPTAKGIYDNARRARIEKEERESAFEGRRRQMKDDLERRESGFFKRKREEDDAEEALEREIKRLAEDGARRRREREERLNRETLEEEERRDQERRGEATAASEETSKGGTEVPDIDRSVKVRWLRNGDTQYDEDALNRLFAQFGTIIKVFMLKEKRKRLDGHKEKVNVATAVVVFSSVVGAHAAIEGKKRENLHAFDSIYWANDAEPEFLKKVHARSPTSEPNTPGTTPAPHKPKQRFSIPDESPSTPLKGIRKVPSFANFSAASTPRGAGTGTGNGTGTPSHEELTMIRLKNADRRRQEEKRQLEEQIRKEEQA